MIKDTRKEKMALTIPPCPLCRSSDTTYAFTARDLNWRTPGSFHYARCRDCVALFTPTGDPLSPGVYPDGYGTFVSPDSSRIQSLVCSPANHKRAALLESRCRTGTLLDIGCGSGFFLAFMRERGWPVCGLDAAPEHVQFARSALNIPDVFLDTWPPSRHAYGILRAVSMLHLLEHMTDPIIALEAARRSLEVGGCLLVETPNIQSWPARLFGPFWVTLDAPRHRVLFSRTSLFQGLKRAGFDNIQITTYSPSTMEWSESIRYLLGRRSKKSAAAFPLETECRPSSAGDDANGLLRRGILSFFHRAEGLTYRCLNATVDTMGFGCNLLASAMNTGR
jgi:SAM-dependent methyltransferase